MTRVLCLVLLLAFPFSCGEPPASNGTPLRREAGGWEVDVGFDLSRLSGRVVSSDGVVVVPNRAWRVHRERGDWLFADTGTLICHVGGDTLGDVVVELQPAADNGLHYRPFWNGEEVESWLAQGESGLIRIEIPATALSVGTHLLTLEVLPRATEGIPAFARLGYSVGGEYRPLDAAEFYRWRFFSDLLNLGVTASYDREMLGGLLFVGPQTLTVNLTRRNDARFVTRVQNSSHEPSKFRLRSAGGEVEVMLEPHEKRNLSVVLPSQDRRLELSAEGQADGLFLWGAPSLVDRRSATLTPIILITLDTTRRDALGPYGEDCRLTPRLCEFAEHATAFDNAVSTAPWTLPSHASIFTGLYPSRHGAGVRSDHLPPRFDTLAERLRRGGYLTAGFPGGPLSSYRFGIAQGFDFFRDPEDRDTPGNVLTEYVEAFLDDFGGHPLFLFVNYFDPHFPYSDHDRPPGPDAKGSVRGELPAAWREVFEGQGLAWQEVIQGRVASTPEALHELRRRYDGEIRFVDHQLGRLFTALRAAGLYERGLIVVTADHGELLGEDGFFSHSSRLDPELVDIPLLIKWPHQREARRIGTPVSLVDLFPTLLHAAGQPVPKQDGIHLRHQAQLARREAVIAEEHEATFHRLYDGMKLAEHSWLRQSASRRQVSWQGSEQGRRCEQRRQGLWSETSCEGSEWAIEAIPVYPKDQLVEDRVGLNDDERATLRTLGYL